MDIFWRLILAHLLTDFTFQTNFIATWKRKSVIGILFHSSIFLVLSFLFTFTYLNQIWWRFKGWICIIIIFIIHFIEDYYRIWSIKNTGSGDNVFFFLWDQFIHIFIIFLFMPVNQGFEYNKIVILLILFILISHFASIFIYYIEESLYSSQPVHKRLEGKYITILTRLILSATILIPRAWFIFVFPVITFICYKYVLDNRFSFINKLLSFIFSLIVGFLARYIIYGRIFI